MQLINEFEVLIKSIEPSAEYNKKMCSVGGSFIINFELCNFSTKNHI